MNIENIIKEIENLGYKSEYKEIEKNGIMRDSFMVYFEDCNLIPTIYVDTNEFEDKTDKEIASVIVTYAIASKKENNVDMSYLFDWNDVKNSIYPCVSFVSNINKNTMCVKLTSDICQYLRIRVDMDDETNASIVVTNELFDKWNISKNEAFIVARNNVREDLFYADMGSLLFGFTENNIGTYVVTNNKRVYGASYMFDREVLRKIANELGVDDFYMLPSSIHEFIIMPITEDFTTDSKELKELIKEVNDTLNPSELLSYSVYKYSSIADIIIEN